MVFKDLIAVYYRHHTKSHRVRKVRGVDLLTVVKADGTYYSNTVL